MDKISMSSMQVENSSVTDSQFCRCSLYFGETLQACLTLNSL